MDITRENYPLFFLDFYEGRLSEEGKGELWRFLELHPDIREEFDRFELFRLEADEEIRYPGRQGLKKEEGFKGSGAPDGLLGQGLQEGDLRADALPPLFGFDEQAQAPVLIPGHYELAFAAYVEGDLDAGQRKAVEAFAASSPVCARALQLMAQTRLEADEGIRFPGKSSLKHFAIGADVATKQHEEKVARADRAWFAGTFRQRLVAVASAAAAVALLAVLTFTLFPLRDLPLTADQDERSPQTEETPVDRAAEPPGAVAEAPALQQDLEREMPARSVDRLIAGTTAVEEPGAAHGQQAVRPDRATARMEYRDSPYMRASILPGRISLASSHPSRIESREPPVVDVPAETRPAQLEARTEYYWASLAERPPLDLAEEVQAGAESRRDLSLATLAARQIEASTGVDVDQLADIAGSEGLARQLAGRGLGGLNRVLGEPVVIGGETTPDGRKVEFALGRLLQVSRTDASRD